MGYKEDLKKINAVLRDPEARCYDPLAGRSPINIQERKKTNQRRLNRARASMRWRRMNKLRYRAYMRAYMAEWRARKKIKLDPAVAGERPRGEGGKCESGVPGQILTSDI